MNKQRIVQKIIDRLASDLEVVFTAAKLAHEASTDSENLPDNKYDTLALEASYVAQGQANRAAELRMSLEAYRRLVADDHSVGTIRLASLVTLEDEDGELKHLFIGPAEGGLRLHQGSDEIYVITPVSPVGRELLGRMAGDVVEVEVGTAIKEYEIVRFC